MYWRAVVQYMQTMLMEIHHPLPISILNVGISNVPLFGYDPVKNRGSGRHFRNLKRDSPLDQAQSSPDPVPGDAPADRVKLSSKSMKLQADFCRIPLIEIFEQAHR